ncbi:MAG: peptide deformylase [Vampirovibrionales bacterium]|nr:peptide deformylase [Vampirovibrionales bacterium]
MSVLTLYKYPNPILRVPGRPLDIEGGELALPSAQRLIDDMIETMYAGPGAIGLAAPQIGQSVRIVVLDMAARFYSKPLEEQPPSELKVLVNPTVLEASRNKVMREGCLSFPDYLASIKRATKVTYQACDRDGVLQTYTVRDLEAIAVQHEIDHLDGILMIDRVASLKTDWIRRTNQRS